jgi:hypothetical protein
LKPKDSFEVINRTDAATRFGLLGIVGVVGAMAIYPKWLVHLWVAVLGIFLIGQLIGFLADATLGRQSWYIGAALVGASAVVSLLARLAVALGVLGQITLAAFVAVTATIALGYAMRGASRAP